MVALRRTAEQHLAEVDRVVADFFGERDGFEPVTPDELSRRMSSGRSRAARCSARTGIT